MPSAVVTVLISRRTEDVPRFQEVLTRHGCVIKTRLGIHEVEGCGEDGLVILYVACEERELASLTADIDALGTVRAKVTKLDF